MYRLFTILALLGVTLSAFSNEWKLNIYEVAPQPMAFLYEKGLYDYVHEPIFILCGDVDVDFDGLYEPDDGDMPASLWIYEKTFLTGPNNENSITLGEVFKIFDLDWGFVGFPTRPTLERGKKKDYKMYVPVSGSLFSYEFNKYSDNSPIIENLEIPVNAGVEVTEDYIIVSNRLDEGDEIHIYSKESLEFIESINTGPLVQMMEVENEHLYVLNEGDFGGDNSTFQVFDISTTELINEIALGSLGNHFSISPKDGLDRIIVTVHGSSKILILSKVDLNIENEIQLQVSDSFNGPRETVYSGGYLYTSSYDGVLFKTNPNNGEVVGTLEPNGKGEGMFGDPGGFFILHCDIYKKGSYERNNTITEWSYPPVSVEEPYFGNPEIYPNPAGNVITIKGDFENSLASTTDIWLCDLNGRKLVKESLRLDPGAPFTHSFNLEALSISPGTYYLYLQNGTYVKGIPFVYSGN